MLSHSLCPLKFVSNKISKVLCDLCDYFDFGRYQ